MDGLSVSGAPLLVAFSHSQARSQGVVGSAGGASANQDVPPHLG